MRNILFTPPADTKILQGTKTFTARYWRIRPPMPGEIVTASTGRRKETRFAKLKIMKLVTWKPKHTDATTLLKKTGYTPEEIAKKEGYDSFKNFLKAYEDLNKHHNPYDHMRTHYLIEFKLIEVL